MSVTMSAQYQNAGASTPDLLPVALVPNRLAMASGQLAGILARIGNLNEAFQGADPRSNEKLNAPEAPTLPLSQELAKRCALLDKDVEAVSNALGRLEEYINGDRTKTASVSTLR